MRRRSFDNNHGDPKLIDDFVDENRNIDECVVDEYIKNCEKYHIQPDPSIIITLKTQWDLLRPTGTFDEGHLLPLANILDKNQHIKIINLSGTCMLTKNVKDPKGNGNSNARILHHILSQGENNVVEEVNVSNTGIDEIGIYEICKGLITNTKVFNLNVSRNHFGKHGANSLQELIKRNKNISKLDISRNTLGFTSVRKLRSCCGRHNGRKHEVALNIQGNYVMEEILNALTHTIGFFLSMLGTILLVSKSMEEQFADTHEYYWAAVIFSCSLLFLYLSSSLYHSFFMIPQASMVLQLLDHAAIYVLIAGSYTPFMMVHMETIPRAKLLLLCEWGSAFFGILFSLFVDQNWPASNLIEVIIYLAMGLAVCTLWEDINRVYAPEAIQYLVNGGIAYVSGIIFYVLGDYYKPIYHAVWHIFVMIGSLCHWWAVFHYIYLGDINISGNHTDKCDINLEKCLSS